MTTGQRTGAGAVLALYGLEPRAATPVTDNPKKPVWRVVAAQGEFYLKRMHVSRGRLHFVLAASEHLNRRGVPTPPVVRTLDGDAFAEWQGQLYVLTRAVPGQRLDTERHLELITKSLAQFHRASRGFRPPPDAEVHSHLGVWPDHYRQKLAELADFERQAREGPATTFHEAFLAEVPHFKDQIAAALELLDGRYEAWVRRCEKEGILCHQDYAASNLRLVRGRVLVFDLDAVTCDLPARDLRKHFNKVWRYKHERCPPRIAMVRGERRVHRPCRSEPRCRLHPLVHRRTGARDHPGGAAPGIGTVHPQPGVGLS